MHNLHKWSDEMLINQIEELNDHSRRNVFAKVCGGCKPCDISVITVLLFIFVIYVYICIYGERFHKHKRPHEGLKIETFNDAK